MTEDNRPILRAPIEDTLFAAPPMGDQERMVEAILFAATDPVSVADLAARMPHGCDPAEALAHLRRRYEARGVTLVRIQDTYAFRTASDLGFLMQKESIEARKLSRAAIETLAIIAYHQPVTREGLKDIFGKDISRDLIGRLHARDLIATGPREPRRGAPYTFVTTEAFLAAFGLESLRDLPDREQLQDAGLSG